MATSKCEGLSINSSDGYSAKEWRQDSSGKHRVYVKGDSGEIGWFDITKGEFVNSERTQESFGLVDEENAKVSLTSQSGFRIHLGNITPHRESGPRDRLKDAVEKMGSMNIKGAKVEINLGPTVELKVNGKSHWAKANLTVGADNVEDIEGLYDVVSEMASAMLDLEINKLSKR